MHKNTSLAPRASFFWAFILDRWKLNRKQTRSLPAGYVPTITAVIPTLNEEENLPHVLPFIPDWVTEVILVDGHSHDNTVGMARQLRPDICVVQQEGRGKGAALRTGFAAAHGDIIVMLDAEGSNDPAEIAAFISPLLSGADFAKGSRFIQGGGTADMPLYRRLGNWGFVTMVRLLFGGSYSDLCYGYNAFWADVLADLQVVGDGFEIETIMNIRVLQAKLKVVEVPSFEDRRRYGEGRLKALPDGWRVLKSIFREWLHPSVRAAHGPRRIPQSRSVEGDEQAALLRKTEVETS